MRFENSYDQKFYDGIKVLTVGSEGEVQKKLIELGFFGPNEFSLDDVGSIFLSVADDGGKEILVDDVFSTSIRFHGWGSYKTIDVREFLSFTW